MAEVVALQAVILAGGQGSRLRPCTDARPKCLVEVRGVPIVRHQVEWLTSSGVDHVVVAAGHRGTDVARYVASLRLRARVDVLVEPRPLGRGGALSHAARCLPRPAEPWIATYGDIWTWFPLPEMAVHHRLHGRTVTMAVTRSPYSRHAVEYGSTGQVTRLGTGHWANAGVYIFAPRLAKMLPTLGDHNQTLTHLATTGDIMGYPINSPWWAINTPADLARINAELREPSTSERS
ncbi:nucleotidyltransferase family protein [Actinokineospora globicatena]|uniref:nucleotidyltransferase family protein n=1 Tax=Actinokineospora globicatena TaxID=103729 RepID=UPI0020A5F357|nr:nucleotidyltransferase family protein [Actinokineospora globicatena]GLW79331.1 guanyltransferase [Actinokineospora globicatena]